MSEKTTMDDVMGSVKALRDEFDKKSPNFDKIDHIEKELQKQETESQKLFTDQKAGEKRETELKERLDALEIEMSRKGGAGSGKDYRESDEYKALAVFARKGSFALDNEQKAILRTDNDAQGGFLVSTEMDNVITKKLTEISAIRSIARVRTISSKSLAVPVRDTIPSAQYEGEAEEGDESNSTYRNETLTAFRQTTTIPITMDMLMDAAFNMESEILLDGGEAFAKGEGTAFVSGSGVKRPTGFTVDPRVVAAARISATSGALSFDDIINVTGDLKTGYNPNYIFNRRTLAFLRTLKGGDGHYLWTPGINGVVANSLNGLPYLIAEDMPDIASNSIPVAFGDFARGYTIVDRTGLAIIRDDITRKKQAIVEFTLQRWNTGQVTLPEAIKLIKIKA